MSRRVGTVFLAPVILLADLCSQLFLLFCDDRSLLFLLLLNLQLLLDLHELDLHNFLLFGVLASERWRRIKWLFFYDVHFELFIRGCFELLK